MSVMLSALGQFFRVAEWRGGGVNKKENKEEKADATSKREGAKENRRAESTKIFEDSSTHGGGWGEICVAASGFRVILLFRGYKVLEAEIVSLMHSQVSERCVPV